MSDERDRRVAAEAEKRRLQSENDGVHDMVSESFEYGCGSRVLHWSAERSREAQHPKG